MPTLQRIAAALLRPQPGWVAVACAVVLTVLGLQAIATVSPADAASQRMWLGFAVVALVLGLLPNPHTLGRVALPLFFLSLLPLLLLIVPGVPTAITPSIGNVRQWIRLGPMQIQPSEFTKVFAVLALAGYLRFRESHRTLTGLVIPFAIMLVPVALVLKQPDLGMSLLYLPMLFAVLVAAGARLSHLGWLVGIAGAVLVVNVALILFGPEWAQVLKPYQADRVRSMFALATGDLSGTNAESAQQYSAMLFVAAGGVTGLGPDLLGEVLASRRIILPEAHNDMIFAVVVNRWGLAGGLGVLALYAGLIGATLLTAARSREPVGRLACVGFAAVFTAQVLIVTGMTVGLLPITGLTLPFISAGGSSLVANFLTLGLILNIGGATPRKLARPSFEFDDRRAAFQ